MAKMVGKLTEPQERALNILWQPIPVSVTMFTRAMWPTPRTRSRVPNALQMLYRFKKWGWVKVILDRKRYTADLYSLTSTGKAVIKSVEKQGRKGKAWG